VLKDHFPTLFPVVALLCFFPFLGGCSTYVKPGEVGILVDNYGSDKGVQPFSIKTGQFWYNPFTTTLYTYPTYIQTMKWELRNNDDITYASSDGSTFSADISCSFAIVADKVPDFYVKFRSNDIHAFDEGFLKNIVRDAFNEVANQYTMEQLYGEKKNDVINDAKKRVNTLVAHIGVDIVQLGYIGAPRPPETVIASINKKIVAIQDAEAAKNVVVRIKAEAEQNVARAAGQAEANKRLSESLTPNLIEWRRLELTQEAINKWNGVRPMVEGSSSGLLMNINPPSSPNHVLEQLREKYRDKAEK
jgi:regulator of protease activity HflC (stomatin/prohibitin superfamily)